MKLYTLDNQFIKETNNIPHKFTGIAEASHGTKRWYIDNKLHRVDGPAVEYSDGAKEWWIDDKEVTEEQHALLVDMMKLKGLI